MGIKFKVDFSNVSEGGGLPAGEYICKITKVEAAKGDKGTYLKWEFTVGTGDMKGSKTTYNTSLTVKALFKLREFILATGNDCPKQVMDIDTDKYLGAVIGIKVIDGTYKDKTSGEEKPTTNISEVYQVKKTDKGWVRAALATVDLDAAVNGATGAGAPPWVAGQEDDVTEIEIS